MQAEAVGGAACCAVPCRAVRCVRCGVRLVDVALRGELDHDLELLHLDVDGVVVLAEEDLDLVREDRGPLLHDEVDVAQRNVLDLGL